MNSSSREKKADHLADTTQILILVRVIEYEENEILLNRADPSQQFLANQ